MQHYFLLGGVNKSSFLELFWKKSSLDEELPEGAIVGGRDTNGCTIYVGKAHYKGEELPAKVIPKSRYAAVAYKGEEIFIKKFKVVVLKKNPEGSCCYLITYLLYRCFVNANHIDGLKVRMEVFQKMRSLVVSLKTGRFYILEEDLIVDR